jgi:energy-coupling factor transporter transmembrane protein EcfT
MHVIVKLMCLVLLAFLLASLHVSQLFWLMIALLSVSFSFKQSIFLNMLRRIKWLLIVLVIIYIFSTSGEYMPVWRLQPRPTYEGLQLGLTQALNIISMLAGLALVLATTSRSKLIGGIYQAFMPLKCLGFNAEKFAVRIWLTLDYVETRQALTLKQLKTLNLSDILDAYLVEGQSPPDLIAIEVYPFKWLDWLLSVLILFSIVWLMVQ